MTNTTVTISTTGSRRGLAAVLLSRRGAVYLPASTSTSASASARGAGPAVDATAGVALLEADLLDRGYLMSAALRQAFTGLDVPTLTAEGHALLADLDRALGADRDHTPLFRRFPDSTPADTFAFYVDRLLTILFQHPTQPCVLCGTQGTVHPVSPCAHLVCRTCFDGSDFSACPICHRRIDADDPFLRPRRPRHAASGQRALPDRLRVLAYGGDLAARTADAGRELTTLLARTSALSPQDADDLHTFLADRDRADLSWLPDTVPGRETKARLLAWLLADPTAYPVTLPAATSLINTATDVLRLLVVRSGGDAGLVTVPRFTAVPRPLRRALLAVLDGLDPTSMAEDLRRHPKAWKHAAERLHPFEHAARYPRAALAFAALREFRLTEDGLSARLRATARNVRSASPSDDVRTLPGEAGPAAIATSPDEKENASADSPGAKVSLPSWPSRVETALAAGDVSAAVSLLARRPGELLRRLNHLLSLSVDESSTSEDARSTGPHARSTGADGGPTAPDEGATGANGGSTAPGTGDLVLTVLEKAVRRVAPAVLLSALGEIRTRSRTRRERVFFPKGGNAKAHIIPDDRAPLPAAVVERAVAILHGEVLRRAGALGAVDVAVVDAALEGVMAPFAERTASRALVTLPRGSELPVPAGRTLRLFLHWMESEMSGRTDLDLSAALFSADWKHIGTCDYTSLRFSQDAAVHSGDLTSAPPPQGASEFIDLDLEKLAAAGVRYVVAVVFSFNNVAFEDLAEGFAGLMARDEPGGTGPVFDPRQVEQRFDLTGRARAGVPLIVDVADRTMRWLDIAQGVTGTHHAVHRHADSLAILGEGLTGLFASGARIGLGELATWQAAARARTVLVRHHDGTCGSYRRGDVEDVAAFAARIGTPATDDVPEAQAARAEFACLLRGDLALPEGSEVFALHPAGLDAGAVRLLTASDLVTSLGETEAGSKG
ncbi:RING finger family 4 domain-containing protein [Streptomyces sp. NPDC003077]|uniref:RING finger family 4 domain-containing protein n=1 Tax=Streptomyces sp. NPDC003077 TaxID=3154443 RepID=UPI0033BCB232